MSSQISNKSIYDRPQLYDDLMWWKKDDIEFWESIIDKIKPDRVLELCCGTGRLGIPIIQKGIDYYGVDISQSFIDFFHQKIINSDYDKGKITRCDIRNINLNQSFDLIIFGFNSLAHLIQDQDVTNCLNHLRSHMSNHSLLVIDIFVPKVEFLYNDPKVRSHIMDFIDSEKKLECQLFESTDYDSKTEINHITWNILNMSGENQMRYNFEMRMFFPDTLNKLLVDSKYQISNFYGDYHRTKFNEDSEKQILLCKKGI